MKVFISSTYQDLVDYRAAVDRTLRRMGHDVIGMSSTLPRAANQSNDAKRMCVSPMSM
jgi:Domain of unknown function (DUF4062)